jgi:hypothetical protein
MCDCLSDAEKAALAECVSGYSWYAWAYDGNHSAAAGKRAFRTALLAANVVRRWKPLTTAKPPGALELAVDPSRSTPQAVESVALTPRASR